MSIIDRDPLVAERLLPGAVLESVLKAIRQETQANDRAERSLTLDIDGIRHERNSGGRFVYRLILSNPVNFSPEQVLRFRARHCKEAILATVLACDDEGVTLESDRPLPTDARLVDVSFDPNFIYRALGDYLSKAEGTAISRDFRDRRLTPMRPIPTRPQGGLNPDQAAAVDAMTSVPIHLLWGPPGTGKTTTVGAAIARWMGEGRRVLVVSTSNAAVDVAMRAVLKHVPQAQRKHLLRLGTSLEPEVNGITPAGRLRDVDCVLAAEARQAQDRLSELADLLSKRPITNDRFQTLHAEYSRLEAVVERANLRVRDVLAAVLPDVRVVGCTLAKMVLDPGVNEDRYDVVVVDEVSMVPVVHALAASTLALGHLVLAGDPKQLPPICQSKGEEARKWFAAGPFDWFGVGGLGCASDDRPVSLLRTQYRMTRAIGGLVSRLTYGGMLSHGRDEAGSPVEFVDLPSDWRTTCFSVRDKSYYHLSSVPIIHKLAEYLEKHRELLLLTPFRPQRSLLAALSFDLKERFPRLKVTASTIHRSQGSESRGVILDLTAHDPERLVAFFRDRHSENLFNVGISRAQDRLFVLGNRKLIGMLARESRFWQELLRELDDGGQLCPASELLDQPLRPDELGRILGDHSVEVESPGIYSHGGDADQLDSFLGILGRSTATRRLLVLPDSGRQVNIPDCVVRHDKDLPPLLVSNGHVAVPFGDGWMATKSPNVARVVWRIGFSHLAEEEVNPIDARRFFCPDCATGDLVLRSFANEGWFLVCTNGQDRQCPYRRRLSLDDAKLKVKLQGMTCPSKHPLTVRLSGSRFFLGCENYPTCAYTSQFSLLQGM